MRRVLGLGRHSEEERRKRGEEEGRGRGRGEEGRGEEGRGERERGEGRGERGEGEGGGGRENHNVISLKALCAHNLLHLSSPLKGLVLRGIRLLGCPQVFSGLL